MKRSILVMFLACLSFSTAYAGKRVDPDVVEDALAFASTDREKAAQLLEDAITNDTALSDDDRDLLHVHAGEHRRLRGDRELAWAHFRAVVDGGRPGSLAAANLGLTLIDAERGVDEAMVARLQSPYEKDVLPTQNADRYLDLATYAAKKGDVSTVRDASKKALAFARTDSEVSLRVRTQLDSLTKRVETLPDDVPAPKKMSSEGAETAILEGRFDDAQKIAASLLEAAAPDSDAALEAKYLQRRADQGVIPDPKKIGVLIPLSGKYEQVGKQIREALEMGYGAAKAQRELVFLDSGDGATTGVAALETLVFTHRVTAVVGPLRTEGAPEIARAANALHVPLISLSQADHLNDDRPWVIEAMITAQDQTEALMKFVGDHRSMSSFAIFAPDSTYGHSAADAFSAAAKAAGKTISVTEFYSTEATNLSGSAAKLKGKTFDAIFVPDSVGRVPLAAAGLAYEEIAVGDFKPTPESHPVPLLGLSGWNSDTMVARGGPYVRGGLFTDIYFPSGSSFDESFRSQTGRTATPMEALTYDIGKLLAIAAASSATTPADFEAALLGASVTGAVTGTTGFDATSREAKHRMRILSVTSRAIIAADGS